MNNSPPNKQKKCNTLLCGKNAEYYNEKTKQFKCANCHLKVFDRSSLAWKRIEKEESGFLQLPPPKHHKEFCVCESNNGKYIVTDFNGNVFFHADDSSSAGVFCVALNNAFKLGVESVLHNLGTFSLDQRRKHAIVWGETQNNEY